MASNPARREGVEGTHPPTLGQSPREKLFRFLICKGSEGSVASGTSFRTFCYPWLVGAIECGDVAALKPPPPQSSWGTFPPPASRGSTPPSPFLLDLKRLVVPVTSVYHTKGCDRMQRRHSQKGGETVLIYPQKFLGWPGPWLRGRECIHCPGRPPLALTLKNFLPSKIFSLGRLWRFGHQGRGWQHLLERDPQIFDQG